jgi:hypothetical protein
MHATTIVALIAAGLALLDFTGASRWVEEKVRENMQGILRTGVETILSQAKTVGWVLPGVLAIGLVAWLSGVEMHFSPSDGAPLAVGGFFLNLFGGGLFLVALYCVLWLLSWPKRGIVSTLGLIVAAIAVALEFIH